MGYKNIAILCVVLGAVIVFRHRENIRRIFSGAEPKIGAKK